MNGKFSANILS